MRHAAHFTILANRAVRDGRLSGLARFVLMGRISCPLGWQTSADQMWRQARKGEPRAGGRPSRVDEGPGLIEDEPTAEADLLGGHDPGDDEGADDESSAPEGR